MRSVRFSQSHPLQIASVSAGEGWGRVGITLCPGKKQLGAMTGAWDRDLKLDVGAIVEWGAVSVVSLIEPHELQSLCVSGLGEAVADALGTSLEFSVRDAGPRITQLVGGGPFGFKAGEWTDDTAMALALAEALAVDPQLDEVDLNRFIKEHNEEPRPFVWKADPDKIIAAVRRGHQTLESIH